MAQKPASLTKTKTPLGKAKTRLIKAINANLVTDEELAMLGYESQEKNRHHRMVDYRF